MKVSARVKRLVESEMLGRKLLSEEIVKFRDGDSNNLDLSNLIVMPRKEGTENILVCVCCGSIKVSVQDKRNFRCNGCKPTNIKTTCVECRREFKQLKQLNPELMRVRCYWCIKEEERRIRWEVELARREVERALILTQYPVHPAQVECWTCGDVLRVRLNGPNLVVNEDYRKKWVPDERVKHRGDGTWRDITIYEELVWLSAPWRGIELVRAWSDCWGTESCRKGRWSIESLDYKKKAGKSHNMLRPAQDVDCRLDDGSSVRGTVWRGCWWTIDEGRFFCPSCCLGWLVDRDKERARLDQERARLDQERATAKEALLFKICESYLDNNRLLNNKERLTVSRVLNICQDFINRFDKHRQDLNEDQIRGFLRACSRLSQAVEFRLIRLEGEDGEEEEMAAPDGES